MAVVLTRREGIEPAAKGEPFPEGFDQPLDPVRLKPRNQPPMGTEKDPDTHQKGQKTGKGHLCRRDDLGWNLVSEKDKDRDDNNHHGNHKIDNPPQKDRPQGEGAMEGIVQFHQVSAVDISQLGGKHAIDALKEKDDFCHVQGAG